MANTFACGLCHKPFSTKSARKRHRKRGCGVKAGLPLAGMAAQDVWDLVESMDLPDGAHFAMIEELSGLEPGDFAQ